MSRIQTNINIRTDAAIKCSAEEIFDQLGLNMTTAVNIFLRQVIRQGGLPFDVKLDVPNQTTAAAIAEGRALLKDDNAPSYDSIEALRAALDV